jgi:glutathione S-transferase
MITIYGVSRSRASRPLWLLAKLGLEFRHVPVIQAYRLTDGRVAESWATDSLEYLAINPMGQVPAFEEDGLILTESLGIILHIAWVHGGHLGSQSGAEAALIDQWILVATTSLEAPALEILVRLHAGWQPEALDAQVERLRRPMRRLNAHLAAREWMVGGRFTAPISPSSKPCAMRKATRCSLPNLRP